MGQSMTKWQANGFVAHGMSERGMTMHVPGGANPHQQQYSMAWAVCVRADGLSGGASTSERIWSKLVDVNIPVNQPEDKWPQCITKTHPPSNRSKELAGDDAIKGRF